ncbi:hypothetical protein [Catellatospora chokoriensis]|uniref:DUF2637 domain-containing protein n=1 Tax=Catellatospora chokoriensis TaxID=310353 RepID=A0A8J3K4R8_9ACTN|nr:hypothetical protein [Catellatospora chokoriensis]GIF90675.1 hypothetical protein Cch02nite_41190 [Catellatospora chokoriensis]
MVTTTGASGRGWAYLGAVLGGTVSVAANIAHTYLDHQDPPALAVAVSVFWPVALFIAVEILARVDWPAGLRFAVTRWGIVPVALVAAVVSYRHMASLLASYGEDTITVTLGPIAVDGLMLLATGALIATAPRTRNRPDTTPDMRRRPTAADPATTTPPAPTPDLRTPALPPAGPHSPRPQTTVAGAVKPTATEPKRPGHRPRVKAAAVSAMVAGDPHVSSGHVAAALGVSERTARRLLAVARRSTATTM